MADNDWVTFLQWALPRMQMRWQGFRKVRGHVIKRISARLQELGLPDTQAYRDYLARHPKEWSKLDGLCRVTVSRYYRDRQVFITLEEKVLPEIARTLTERGDTRLHVWSAGCASGEEPYTVAIVWILALRSKFPFITIDILATDADAILLKRGETASYRHSSIKNLPSDWRDQVFDKTDETYCLRQELRRTVRFQQHDIRNQAPTGTFHLILCRNLVFTYFAPDLQMKCLHTFRESLMPEGYLIVGIHEGLPEGASGFEPVSRRLGIYRKKTR